MKLVRFFLSLWMAVMLVGASVDLFAQGRGKGYGRDNNPGRGHDKHIDQDRGRDKERGDHDKDDHREYRDSDRDYDHDRYSHHDSYNYRDHYVTYRHHRHGPPSWAPAYGYRYNTRYIYYRDYNVYYDCHRDIFITWTGRNWVISTRIPDVICHADFGSTCVMGVDYWGDDFDYYLGRKRPVYLNIQATW